VATPLPAALLRSAAGRRPHLLDVQAAVSSGRLGVALHYAADVHLEATAERLAAALCAWLEALARLVAKGEEAATPSDFPGARLDQGALDRFLSSVRSQGGED
jgi:non-ribosomal peptide synthase protein (TIGR01720 family)